MKIDRKTILAIALGVAALGVVTYQFTGVFSSNVRSVTSAVAAPTPTPAVSSPPAAPSSAMVASASETTLDYESFITTLTESDIDYAGGGFRNPMTPLISAEDRDKNKTSGSASKVAVGPTDALSMGYTIEGIVWNEVDPLALVNEQVVTVGESLTDGALITDITRDTVRFKKNGKNYFLVFKED